MNLIDTYLYQIFLNFPATRMIDNLVYKFSKSKNNLDIILTKLSLLSQNVKNVSDLDVILIAGCPRSGTTLARALIGMHPGIACPQSECYFLTLLKSPDVLKSIFNFSAEEINNFKKIFNEDATSFAEHVLKFYMQKEKKQFVALKAPIYVTIVDEIFKHFPNMKFIHCIRDGRDVVCSLRTFPKRRFVKGEIVPTNIKNPFGACIKKWISHVKLGRRWMDSDQYFEVKYEDLVNNTQIAMKKIFDFIGVEMPSKEQLQSYYKYEKDEKHPQNIEIGKPIYKESIERWKTDLSIREQEKFKKLAGDLLIMLGYENDNNW